MTKRKTNVQCVTEIMKFSKHGALAEVMVMHAIDTFTRNVINSTPHQLAKQTDSLASPSAWVAVAEEIINKLEAHYAS
jgi:hypothetical protein